MLHHLKGDTTTRATQNVVLRSPHLALQFLQNVTNLVFETITSFLSVHIRPLYTNQVLLYFRNYCQFGIV